MLPASVFGSTSCEVVNVIVAVVEKPSSVFSPALSAAAVGESQPGVARLPQGEIGRCTWSGVGVDVSSSALGNGILGPAALVGSKSATGEVVCQALAKISFERWVIRASTSGLITLSKNR